MSSLPTKCVVDTNVPKTANLARDPNAIPDELIGCVQACVDIVEQVVKQGRLVIDAGDEIFDEYRHNLALHGQPGVGDRFLKWVHDNRWSFPNEDRVPITRDGESYAEFPDHEGLAAFDNSDRKFVAVAHAHRNKPPIMQATDSKWWGWRKALDDVGIAVHFLCEEYIQAKYAEKMGS